MAATHSRSLPAHHALLRQDELLPPQSPTFTNSDLILPDEPRYLPTSPSSRSDVTPDSSYPGSPTNVGRSHHRNDSDSSVAELGVATALVMPGRLNAGPPATIARPPQLSIYQGYEHGAPLSDIGEEGETEVEDDSDGASTTRGGRSPSPDEMDDIVAEVEKLAGPPLRHKKRLSNISVESNESDRMDWEKFDTSKLASGRVAADIARARSAANTESAGSRRNSKEAEDELAILNDRADQILENARQRLSNMEDNLSKARHSMVLSSSRSSPNMHELGLGQQPGGGLYRSISQSAANRRSKGFPVKPNTVLSHGRAGSDNVVTGSSNRLSKTPEVRSVSALEYGRPWLGSSTPEKTHYTHSPASSRSFNSPLRILAEEVESPSTLTTSPDSTSTPTYLQRKGLGIHPNGGRGQEDLVHPSKSPPHADRPNSQASTRSTRDLKDQMTEMKSRIAELRNKAQADTLRRRSMQSLRTSSPNNIATDLSDNEYGRSSSPLVQDRPETSLGHSVDAGTGWRSIFQQGHHQRRDSALDEDNLRLQSQSQPQQYQTPITNRFLNVSTPAGASSARTDRNTPNLANRLRNHDEEGLDFESQAIPSSSFEAAEQNLGEAADEDEIFANEEEQIYLNEMLEESLHEPEVPTIPLSYLAQSGAGEERHEDRLDAFDYENMFLHSAMGNYLGNTDSDEDEGDDNNEANSENESESDSVVTSKRDVRTPTGVKDLKNDGSGRGDEAAIVEEEEEDELEDTDEEILSDTSSPTRSSASSKVNSQTEDQEFLEPPTKPWMKHNRSNSMESTSSAATFETATEGHGRDLDDENSDDEAPDEILNWGSASNEHLGMQQTDPTLPSSPLGVAVPPNAHVRHDSGSGMEAVTQQAPLNNGILQNGHVPPILTQNGTDSDEYDDDQPTPHASTFDHDETVFPQPPTSRRTQPPVAHNHMHTDSSSTIATVRETHHRSSSSMQSRSINHATPPTSATPPAQAYPSPPYQNHVGANQSVHPANTEILMESLIKLADPSFTITPDTRFAEVDKELVLKLLRALGGVCNGILHAEKRGLAALSKELRGRLRDGEEVLFHGLGGEDDDGEDVETEGEDVSSVRQNGDHVNDDDQSIMNRHAGNNGINTKSASQKLQNQIRVQTLQGLGITSPEP